MIPILKDLTEKVKTMHKEMRDLSTDMETIKCSQIGIEE